MNSTNNIINLFNIINNYNSVNSLNNILERTIREQEDIKHPCSASFVDKLEKVTITNEDVDNNLCCAICQDSFKMGEKAIKLPCKDPHYFHYQSSEDVCEGILPWLKDNNSCPICREKFPEEEEEETDNEEEIANEEGINDDDIPVPDENFDNSSGTPNTNSSDSRDELVEDIVSRMINQLSSRNVRYELMPRPRELAFRPMELTFQTIELPPIMSNEERYEADMDEAIRRSLQD